MMFKKNSVFVEEEEEGRREWVTAEGGFLT
jgi:hypothetical protein